MSATKWKVSACRCTPCTAFPQHAEWQVCGPELGQVSDWLSWDAAYRYAKTCADNHWRKVAAAEAQMEHEAYVDEALPVDGAVWVGSREFQWPQVKRYGEPEGVR